MSNATTQHSPATNALINAVQQNDHNGAKTAIRHGANVNVKLNNGNSLLHICTDVTMGTILINHGANVDATDSKQQTPLHVSMRRGLIPLTLLFLSSSANVNLQDVDGTAPLHLAEANVVNDGLIASGADVNVQDANGDTPLHLAIRLKGSPIVIALLNAGADKTIANHAGDDADAEFNNLLARREAELIKIENALYPATALAKTASAVARRGV